MTNHLGFFKEEAVATTFHEYFTALPGVVYKDAENSHIIGYYKQGQRYKFATLHGPSLQSIILHVDPGYPNSSVGKEKQIEVQAKLDFDIKQLRTHKLKQHEAYIPLEKLKSTDSITQMEEFIRYAYYKQDKVTNK